MMSRITRIAAGELIMYATTFCLLIVWFLAGLLGGRYPNELFFAIMVGCPASAIAALAGLYMLWDRKRTWPFRVCVGVCIVACAWYWATCFTARGGLP